MPTLFLCQYVLSDSKFGQKKYQAVSLVFF